MEASHLLGLRVDIPASTRQPWKTANEVTQSALQVSLPALRGIKDYYFLRRQSPAPDILRCGRYTLLAVSFHIDMLAHDLAKLLIAPMALPRARISCRIPGIQLSTTPSPQVANSVYRYWCSVQVKLGFWCGRPWALFYRHDGGCINDDTTRR